MGTCACDYSPKLKDEFKDKFDFDARRSSCLLINGRVLVDCGDHTLDCLRIAKVNKSAVTDVVITHLHSDHFRAENIEKLAYETKSKLRVWVREDAVVPSIKNVEIMRMKKKTEYEIYDGFKVTGLIANHDENAYPQHLYFEQDGKTFLYGCDGAWLIHETYKWLADKKLTLYVLDGTCGNYEGDFRIAEHNLIPMIRLMLPSLKTIKAITDDTILYISHLAPSLHKPHAETVELLKKDKINVAYDGLKITI